MTNKNFGILKGNYLEYAPNSFKTDIGIIINPPKEFYLAKGYYKIIDNKPEPESGCFVKFNGYDKNEENKTITFIYDHQIIPIIEETYTYSKLKLEMAMFQIGKTQEFDDFIDNTILSNDFGQTAPLRKFYDQANDLKSNNQYFETYSKLGQQFLGIDDNMAQQILSSCIMEA